MISARPVTAASGRPPAMPLAVVIRSGTTPSCSQANIAPVRAKPVWISSAMKTTPLAAAPVGERGEEARRGHDEAALALDRLDDDRGEVAAPTCFSIWLSGAPWRPRRRTARRGTGRTSAPGRPRRRTARSRSCRAWTSRSAPWSGWCARGRRGRRRRRPAARCGCRAILTAFSTASAPELNRADALVVVAGGEPVQPLGDLDVAPRTAVIMKQVWVKRADLLGDRRRHRRVGVADAGDRDAGAEVDQRVAVDVDDHAAAGGGRVDGHGHPDAGRDGGGLARLAARRCADPAGRSPAGAPGAGWVHR